MTGFDRDIRPGTVIKVTSITGQTTTYDARGYAKAGERHVSARIRNLAMPSGWEAADVCLMSGDSVEYV